MINRCFQLLAVAIALAPALPRAAQSQALSAPILPVTPRLYAPLRDSSPVNLFSSEATSPRPSFWLQGGIIGALVFAGAAAWFSRICESSDVGGSCGAPRVKFILGAIPLGFITGALIGGNIHPHQAEPPPSQ
jgi:hypothetical protein